MKYLYVIHEMSSTYGKYGICSKDNISRLFDGQTYYKNKIIIDNLYEISEKDNYQLYKNYDNIITFIGKDLNKIKQVESFYKSEFKYLKLLNNYLINEGGGTELFNIDGLDTLNNFINNELSIFGLNVNEKSREYIDDLIEKNKQKNSLNDKINNDIFNKIFGKKINELELRDYQKVITSYILNNFENNNKIYLNLATGGGKSFIIFYILSKLLPDIIIIFSPRTKINEQNISRKYINMLNNNYDIFNISSDKNFTNFINSPNKKIICCCTQSADKLYCKIRNYNLKNIFIWYDESHWGVDNWIINKKNIFWLENNYKKIFTSASPDESFIKSNINYFGQYYKPFTVKNLIDEKWLCEIITYMYETPNNNTNIIKYLLKHFKKHKKNFGFSFHSSCSNAFNLFYKHYKRFSENKTKIKPFLLISINEYVKGNLEKIKLDYDFMNVNLFEYTKNSISYVVKQYDMGYDFSKLDFITFSDPKMSGQDIIQCIGRGTRPDKLNNGKNLNKKCDIVLPVFINDNDETEYDKIINVLTYLINDCGIDFDKVLCNNYKTYEIESITGKDYEGKMNTKSELVEKLKYTISTTKRLYKICIENNIYNEELYERFKNDNKYYKMKKNIYDYKGFKWKDIVDPNGNKYYKTFEECNKAMDIIIENINRNIDSEELLEELEDYGMIKYNEYDNKIPPYNKLKKYYY
jgi:hypothetical protein